MGNEFIENNKLFEITGTINRRNFIANYLVVMIINAVIYTTPAMLLMFIKPELMMNAALTGSNSLANLPLWMIIWHCSTCILSVLLIFPSVIKRIRDITGQDDNTNISMICTAILLFGCIPFYVKGLFILDQIFSGVVFFIMLSLMCMKGKISGEKPTDEIAKFNWGAMFGTWIWGLINKSYVTLLAIPLFLTCGFFPFMLLCGIKGNEWTYAKLQNVPVEDFHKNQSAQSAWFSAIIPALAIILSVTCFITGSVLFVKYLDKNPRTMDKLQNYSTKMIISTTEAAFDKIEITDEEYKFYINPVNWNNLPDNAKKNLFITAENYILAKYPEKFGNSKRIKTEDLLEASRRIKIYSTFNNEILARRDINIEEYKNLFQKYKRNEATLNELIKFRQNGYKFNLRPTLP